MGSLCSMPCWSVCVNAGCVPSSWTSGSAPESCNELWVLDRSIHDTASNLFLHLSPPPLHPRVLPPGLRSPLPSRGLLTSAGEAKQIATEGGRGGGDVRPDRCPAIHKHMCLLDHFFGRPSSTQRAADVLPALVRECRRCVQACRDSARSTLFAVSSENGTVSMRPHMSRGT